MPGWHQGLIYLRMVLRISLVRIKRCAPASVADEGRCPGSYAELTTGLAAAGRRTGTSRSGCRAKRRCPHPECCTAMVASTAVGRDERIQHSALRGTEANRRTWPLSGPSTSADEQAVGDAAGAGHAVGEVLAGRPGRRPLSGQDRWLTCARQPPAVGRQVVGHPRA